MYYIRMARESSINPHFAIALELHADTPEDLEDKIAKLQAAETGNNKWERQGEIVYDPVTCAATDCDSDRLGSSDYCYAHNWLQPIRRR